MKTLTRLRLQHELDEFMACLLCKSKRTIGADHDAFAPHEEELQIRALLYDRWQAGVQRAMNGVRAADQGRMLSVDTLMGFFDHVLGKEIAHGLKADVLPHIAGALNKGRASVNAAFTKQTGREPSRQSLQKDFVGGNAMFGVMFGLTEDHAIQALIDQLTVAAGGFWEDQLSTSIKEQLQSYFDGATSRADLVGKIETMVNDRLSLRGDAPLAKSYYDNLATHQVVRARNVGSYYRAKSLGASHYVLINPHDHRTSPVCNKVADGMTRYEMAGADETVSGILTAGNVSDLKSVAPFYKAGDTVTNPVPPLHWPKCRTWMNFVFE